MKMKLILGVMLLVLICAQSASADSYSPPCAVFINQSTDWTATQSIPQFDSSMGVLDKVTVTGSACLSQFFKIDSEDTAPQCYNITTTADISTSLPAGHTLAISLPLFTDFPFCVSEDTDDEPDFIGTDSFRKFDKICDDTVVELTDPDDLSGWIGTGSVYFE